MYAETKPWPTGISHEALFLFPIRFILSPL